MGWPDLYKSYVFCEFWKVHYHHLLSQKTVWSLVGVRWVHSKITMADDVVPYYTVAVLVPTLK